MKSELLIIGDEILDGRRTDTNATWLGRKLSLLGCPPRHKQSVTDRVEDIVSALALAFSRSDMVFCTGGLGPTTDDLTFESVAKFFSRELEFHCGVWEKIESKYAAKDLACPESNRRQAMLPKEAEVFENLVGTAPGIHIRQENKSLFCFPGVPAEMKQLFEDHAEKVISKQMGLGHRMEQKYTLVGAPESWVQDQILSSGLDEASNQQDGSQFRLAYTASFPRLELTISREGRDKNALEILHAPYHEKMAKIFDSFLVGIGPGSIEEDLIANMRQHNLTLALAESMTGGMLSSRLIGVPGSSKVLLESCVTYSNDSKIKRLGVEKQTLEHYGAVSEACALEMARGMQKRSGADIALASTGIAGPDGATDSKPLGLTYLAIAGPKLESPLDFCSRFQFQWSRNQNREMAVYEALKILIKAVKTQNNKK